ncbi:phosphonate C-P lyase system protein PhnG [Halomonas ventosae]|jgi:alpha-D-ribose 1-methylphosphonate 5-triphosphate synthase subunit PhnG|uniref:Phosphonate metabolism protein PhnG n=1 Tax=Halomonas ventosae TaxID=229007 RepID=A0A4R6GQI0_9GAMM|nr:phosphonate C-P lyase system protein PhnG [Halomonas ventosae]TDN97572.1 phosphonate metabolism protein PhnG [Halomonas ventosae]
MNANQEHTVEHLFGLVATSPVAALKQVAQDFSLMALARSARARTARMMLPLPDPVSGGRFFLGEVLVAEATAEAQGLQGYMIRVGDDLHAARLGAAIMLAAEEYPERVARITELLGSQLATGRHAAERAAVRATRVRFDGGEAEAYAASDFTTDR